MISRLVLNLRSIYSDPYSESGSDSPINIRRGKPEESFLTRTIGNLGENLFASEHTTSTGDAGGSENNKREAGIPMENVSRTRRSQIPGNIP